MDGQPVQSVDALIAVTQAQQLTYQRDSKSKTIPVTPGSDTSN